MSGPYSVIGGGSANTVAGDQSVIPGGRNLTLSATADNSFGFNSGVTAMTISAANTSVFANSDLWLANNDNTPRELRFYEAYNASGAFPNTAKYVAFKSPSALTATQTYTLPVDYPSVSGRVLSSTTGGVLSWVSGSGLTNFTEAINTSAPNATVPVASLTATNAATDVDAAFIPKGTGALLADIPDGTVSGGNKRGQYAVDLQLVRADAANVASGNGSVITGGWSNTASGGNSVISGGQVNVASGDLAVIGGGQVNTASGLLSFVGGGEGHTVSGVDAVITGGYQNIANADYTAIGGGRINTASGIYSSIAGGNVNIASGTASAVGGGSQNYATAQLSAVVGGAMNTAAGDYSTILGGRGLTLDAAADGSFGYLGGNAGSNDMTISAPNTAVFGNTNLWLANNNSTASELRFYEAESGAGAFPSGTKYVAFKSPSALTATQTYTLPLDYPGVSGYVLSSTTGGTMSWAALPTGDVVGPASALDNAVTRYDGTTGKLVQNSALIVEDYSTSTQNKVVLRADDGATANISLVLAPKGSGAIIADNPDGAATGGNARGQNAVDLQTSRTANTQVASGNYSTVSGGDGNTASNSNSTVSGGANNAASAVNSTVSGGASNTASGSSSTVSGGSLSTASGTNSTVSGGLSNTASGVASTVSGAINTVAGDYSVIMGGRGLTLDAAADGSFGYLGGNAGSNDMTISAPNTAVFGNTNLWLANNDNTPRELRFYEAYNASGAFPNTANYSAFKAGTQTADITYTLPTTQPAAGQVLAATAVSGSGPYAVTMGWASPSAVISGANTDQLSTATSTEYLYPIGMSLVSSTESLFGATPTTFIVNRSGVIKNLYVKIDAVPGASNSRKFTIRVNGSNSSVTTTIGAAATSNSDLSNTVTVSAGDEITIEVVTTKGGSNVAGRRAAWSFGIY